MDERAINGAAIEAIKDLELDCEIKDVCRSGDDWCVEFSGKYGNFCDGFKNQFGEENGSQVIREKIKSHLIKQVSKIRSSTGRRRKSGVVEASERREPEGDLLTAPLKVVGEVFDQASGLAGEVVRQASTAATAARDVLASVANTIRPAAIEMPGTASANQKRASGSTKVRTTKAAKAKPAKAKKATEREAGKRAKKAGKSVRKAAGRTQKAARKAAQKK